MHLQAIRIFMALVFMTVPVAAEEFTGMIRACRPTCQIGSKTMKRKRNKETFQTAPDVAKLLCDWKRAHPTSNKSRILNEATRLYFALNEVNKPKTPQIKLTYRIEWRADNGKWLWDGGAWNDPARAIRSVFEYLVSGDARLVEVASITDTRVIFRKEREAILKGK